MNGASGLEFALDPNTGNIEKFYHGDVRGSVVFTTDINADVIDNHFNKYDDFGNIITPQSAEAEEYGAFYYLGKHGIINDVTAYDGLYQVKARYYDAKLGRFLTQDPIWSTNLYPYANNNPISNIDRNGRNSMNAIYQGLLSYSDGMDANVIHQIDFRTANQIANNSYSPNSYMTGYWIGFSAQMVAYVGGMFVGGAGIKGISNTKWKFGGHKSSSKWANQLANRGWTQKQIGEAIANGKQFSAINNVNKANTATRYVHPVSGQSIVVDNVTNELLHVGGVGFKY